VRIPASRDPHAALMPPLEDAPAVAQAVAEAVALRGVREGRARRANTDTDAMQQLAAARWTPKYSP
jgi:malic enzyme